MPSYVYLLSNTWTTLLLAGWSIYSIKLGWCHDVMSCDVMWCHDVLIDCYRHEKRSLNVRIYLIIKKSWCAYKNKDLKFNQWPMTGKFLADFTFYKSAKTRSVCVTPPECLTRWWIIMVFANLDPLPQIGTQDIHQGVSNFFFLDTMFTGFLVINDVLEEIVCTKFFSWFCSLWHPSTKLISV